MCIINEIALFLVGRLWVAAFSGRLWVAAHLAVRRIALLMSLTQYEEQVRRPPTRGTILCLTPELGPTSPRFVTVLGHVHFVCLQPAF